MRSFVFENKTYTNLNDLGLAFKQSYQEALKAISTKPFLKFLKKQKKLYPAMRDILYKTRSLETVLSILIYHFTTDRILYIDHTECRDITILQQMVERQNPKMLSFLSEQGLSNTLLLDWPNEKEKADFRTFEEYCQDPFAVKYCLNFRHYDEITDLKPYFQDLKNDDQAFKKLWELFSDEAFQLQLVSCYSLEEVLKMRQASCPVFKGLQMVQAYLDESFLKEVLQNHFGVWFLNHLSFYSFKKEGKKIRKSGKRLKKEGKHLLKKKSALSAVAAWSEACYDTYLKAVMLFKKGRIKTKNDAYSLVVSYLNTFVCPRFLEESKIKETVSFSEEQVPVSVRPSYDLRKLEKSIVQHGRFAKISIFVTVLLAVYLGLQFIDLKDWLSFDFHLLVVDEDDRMLALLFFGVALGCCLLLSLLILWLKRSAAKKYNRLCQLKYLRNNEAILTTKETDKLKKLTAKEEKYSRKIDRFYRFYGSLLMVFLSFSVSYVVLSVLYSVGFLQDEITELFSTYRYLLLIPFLLPALCGLLRHKKTGFSVLLTVLFSALLAAGCIYLVPYLG